MDWFMKGHRQSRSCRQVLFIQKLNAENINGAYALLLSASVALQQLYTGCDKATVANHFNLSHK